MTKEVSFFFSHSRQLGKKYPGKYIAIVDGKVVAVGANRLEVYKIAIKDIPLNKRVGIFYLLLKDEVLTAL